MRKGAKKRCLVVQLPLISTNNEARSIRVKRLLASFYVDQSFVRRHIIEELLAK